MNRFIVVAFLLCITSLYAAIPEQINYQGFLTDTSGTPLDSTHDLTFRLYTTPTGGTAFWTEIHDDVMVTNGLFDVMLGYYNPLDSIEFDQPYYLGVSVDNDTEMIPRKPFSSVAYSLNAKSSESGTGNSPVVRDSSTFQYYSYFPSASNAVFPYLSLTLNCPAAGIIVVTGQSKIAMAANSDLEIAVDTTTTASVISTAFLTFVNSPTNASVEQSIPLQRTFHVQPGNRSIYIKVTYTNPDFTSLNFGPLRLTAVWYPN